MQLIAATVPPTRRRLLQGVAATLGCIAAGMQPAAAQVPEGVIRLGIGFPVGGSGDLFARILIDPLREELGRTIVIENRPGGGGITVAISFLRAPKDGTQLLMATGSTAISAPISRAKPPYNPVDDFQWIALLSNAPFVIAVNPALPVNDLKGLVDYAKARPNKLSYSHSGLGSTVHLAAELFKDRAGVDIADIAYSGGAGATTDLIAGNVQMTVNTTGTLLPHHLAGKVRILCSMAEARERIAPDIPTAREAGYDLIAGTCNLLAAPRGTPSAVVDPIARAVSRVMERPAIQEKLYQLGIEPITGSTPEQARAYVAGEVARWTPIVKKLGIAL